MSAANAIPMRMAPDSHSQGFPLPPPCMNQHVSAPQHPDPCRMNTGVGGPAGGVGFGTGPGQVSLVGQPVARAGAGRMGAVSGPAGVGPMYPASYPASRIDDHSGSALPGPSGVLGGRVIDEGYGPSFEHASRREMPYRIWEDSNGSRNGSNTSGEGFGNVHEDYTQRSVSDRPLHRDSEVSSSSAHESFASGSHGPIPNGPGARTDSSGPHSTQPSTRPSTDAASERPLDVSGEPPPAVEASGADASFRSPLTPRQALPQSSAPPVRSPMACLSTDEAPTAQLARPGAPQTNRPIPVPTLDFNRRSPRGSRRSPRPAGDENRAGAENHAGADDENQSKEPMDKEKGDPLKQKSASASRRSRSLSNSLQQGGRAGEGSPQGRESRGRATERSRERGRSVLGELPNHGNRMPEVKEAAGTPEGVAFMTPMSTYYPHNERRPAVQPRGVEPRRLSLRSKEDPQPEADPAVPAFTLPDRAVPAPEPPRGISREDPAEPARPSQPREFAGRMSPVQEPQNSAPPPVEQAVIPPTRLVGAPEPVEHALPPSQTQDTGSQTRRASSNLPSVPLPAPASIDPAPASIHGAATSHPRLIPNGVPPPAIGGQSGGGDPGHRAAQGIQTQGRMPPPTHAAWAQPPAWAHRGAHALAPNQMWQMGAPGQYGGPMMPGQSGIPPMGYPGMGCPPGMGMGFPAPYVQMQQMDEESRSNLATAASAIGGGVRVLGSATAAVAGAAAPVLGKAALGAGRLAVSGIGAAAQAGLRMARGDGDDLQADETTFGPMGDRPPMPPDPRGRTGDTGSRDHGTAEQGQGRSSEQAGSQAARQEPSDAGLLLPDHISSNDVDGPDAELPIEGTSPSNDGDSGRAFNEIGVGTDPVEDAAGDPPGDDDELPPAGFAGQGNTEFPGAPEPPPGMGHYDDGRDSFPLGDSPPPEPPPGADADGGNSAVPEAPVSFTLPQSQSQALAPAAAEVGQIVPRKRKLIEKPKVPKKLMMLKVDLPGQARACEERASRYPLRRRIEPLSGWKNERVIYERKPGSALPTLCGYFVAADLDDPNGGLEAKRLPQGVIEDSSTENVSPSLAKSSPSYSPLQDASAAESSPQEHLQRLRKSPSRSAAKPKKAEGPAKGSVARRAGRGRQVAVQKKQAVPKRQAAAGKGKGRGSKIEGDTSPPPQVVLPEQHAEVEQGKGKEDVIEHDTSVPPQQTLSPEYLEPLDGPPSSAGLTERIFHSPASDGGLDAADLADAHVEPDVEVTQHDEDSEDSASSSSENALEPPRQRRRLWLHANEGASTEIPAVPGSKGGVNMIGGLHIPGLVGCTLMIPPESWNEEEVLPSDRTILFYVMQAQDQSLYAEIDGVGQRIALGDSFIVHPGRRWVIKNESQTESASVKMLLVSHG
eukprot:gnl/MRDRNA2_/MRDRNA2_70171_c0_seq1.p1 gnl/MRDRNA2_/MRDRNA2_70171_c0~~gnl/MRDRNA2_/MRDRNA2_70171_c0_seq1.p1  ORF type:complete len:1415 (+),score=303.74 gnl/MRDRNA2_/MRDRNA2_70171_c0_seq1:74-4246(+)